MMLSDTCTHSQPTVTTPSISTGSGKNIRNPFLHQDTVNSQQRIIDAGTSKLKVFAKDIGARWHQNRMAAEATARAHRLPIRIDRGDSVSYELQTFERSRPHYYTTNNLNSAITTSTDKVWPGAGFGFSLTGLSDTLGIWDAGAVRTTHQEFGGRVVRTEGLLNFHSTHVAGTLIAAGVLPGAHGMSSEANLISYDWNNDLSEMAEQAANGLRVSNHSYSLITGWTYDFFGDGQWVWFGDTSISQSEDYRFGFYDDEARTWDSLAFEAPNYLIVKAAANDRGAGPGTAIYHWIFVDTNRVWVWGLRENNGGTSGYDCLNGAGVSKNVLCVGAVGDVPGGYQNASGVIMTPFSNWGPTDDGRIKPDIVADGVSVFSSSSGSDVDYTYLTGTSMAAPNVAGSVGLLHEYQRNLHGNQPLLASTIRGLLVNTADECGPSPGPDYMFGWGLMNTLKAVQLMRRDSADGSSSHIMELTLDQNDTIWINILSDGRQPLRSTLCWTDPPGSSPTPSLNPPNPMLVNDLDLRVIHTSTQTVSLPWILDHNNPSAAATKGDNVVDNIEEVQVDTPARGHYTLRVTHKGTLAGGRQRCSLIVSGNVASIGPVLALQPDTLSFNIIPEDSLSGRLLIRNDGDAPLQYHFRTPSVPWISLGIDSGSVAIGDSAVIPCEIRSHSLHQWTTYSTTITVSTSDSVNPSASIPVFLNVLGPALAVHPLAVTLTADTGGTAHDSIWILSTGDMPLIFTVGKGDNTPPWLTFDRDSGNIAVQESTSVLLTAHATSLPVGTYTANLTISSNDSSHPARVLRIQFWVGLTRTITTQISGAWNIVSLPVLPANNAKSALYPSSVSAAFGYNGAYTVSDSLYSGQGYWLRFPTAQTVPMQGIIRTDDTIRVNDGWNLIGSISLPIPVSSIASIPASLVTSDCFAYANGYTTTDTIWPGSGYWIKITQAGLLILSSNPPISTANRIIRSHGMETPPAPPTFTEPSSPGLPSAYLLAQAYPNPFNPTTTIRYQLPEPSRVRVVIFNLLGQSVSVLADDIESGGYKQVEWNAQKFPSAIYFCRLEAVNMSDPSKFFTGVRKLLLIK